MVKEEQSFSFKVQECFVFCQLGSHVPAWVDREITSLRFTTQSKKFLSWHNGSLGYFLNNLSHFYVKTWTLNLPFRKMTVRKVFNSIKSAHFIATCPIFVPCLVTYFKLLKCWLFHKVIAKLFHCYNDIISRFKFKWS